MKSIGQAVVVCLHVLAFLLFASESPAETARQHTLVEEGIAGEYIRVHMIKVVTDEGFAEITATDSLTIHVEEDGQLSFSFELRFNNGHSCQMNGRAQPVDGYFEYRELFESSATDLQECVLRILPVESGIDLVDVDRGCGWGAGYCGVRGTIGGATFTRSK